MQIQKISNNTTFGNARGGIKNLKIIKNKEGLQLLETSKPNSDVSVFVAGGSQIDKKVDDANINAMKKLANKTNETKQKSGIRSFFSNLIKA